MKPDPLPPIPVTPRLRWRLFRERVVPVVMFLVLVGVTIVVWSRFYGAPTMSGVADGLRTTVASPQAGWLRELKVYPYQLVNQGDPIAIIEPVDARMPLDLLQAELDLARLRHEPSVADQNAMNYERVRVEFLRLQAELATARVNLARADNDVASQPTALRGENPVGGSLRSECQNAGCVRGGSGGKDERGYRDRATTGKVADVGRPPNGHSG